MLSVVAGHAEAAPCAPTIHCAQRQIAFAHRILQAPGRPRRRRALRVGRAGRRDGKQRRIGNAAGEGDDARLVEQLQQLADFGGAHALGTARVARLPVGLELHGLLPRRFLREILCQYC